MQIIWYNECLQIVIEQQKMPLLAFLPFSFLHQINNLAMDVLCFWESFIKIERSTLLKFWICKIQIIEYIAAWNCPRT